MKTEIRLTRFPPVSSAIPRFLEVAHSVYQDDPHWVAPLRSDIQAILSPKNPWFRRAEMALWIAQRGSQDVGRIAAIIDPEHNRVHREASGFFGFFESVPDPEVASRLFGAVQDWAQERRLDRILGPMNPTTNNECGLLVEGFNQRPVVMMTYNPSYYVDHLTAAGYEKAMDLLAFHFAIGTEPMERLERAARLFSKRQADILVRPVRRSTLHHDLQKIKEVYNAAWSNNWGFVPMTDDEIRFMADRLKPLLVEGLVWLAETPQEPVAFLLSVPDYNEVLRWLRGRVLTLGLLQALPYLAGLKEPRLLRVVTFGVKEAYRRRGIESQMLLESLKVCLNRGYKECEASWILEKNVGVQRLIELFGGRVYKRYRIYQRQLNGAPSEAISSPESV